MCDDTRLEVLHEAEARRLLAKQQIGRVAFTDQALPAIQPVNFVVDGDAIIVRTRPGSKLAAALRTAVVAFEVDEFDLETDSGWNVTVVGASSVVSDPSERERYAGLGLPRRVPGFDDSFVRIAISLIQGRRLHPAVGWASSGRPIQGLGSSP